MGKGTDKLYITHSEWSSEDAFSASAGSDAGGRGGSISSFKHLPFNFCAASLQPFKNPVCTADGTIFDVEVISAWLDKHGTNPVTGEPLAAKDLIKLNFARNADTAGDAAKAGVTDGKGDLIDPVTFKVLTENTHVVAIRHGSYANVFAWETVERMNIKAKMWRDLVDDAEFTRKDIITLQDPRNAASRDLSQFKHIRDGEGAILTKAQEEERKPTISGPLSATRNEEKIAKAREAVDRARKERENGGAGNSLVKAATQNGMRKSMIQEKKLADNAATYTTGKAAASFTSTGLTPETSGERAILTDEEWMLKPRRVKVKGYARMETNLGDLTLELHTDTAPKAVWNFVRLSQTGYYKGVFFHRNIRNFMIQGGDPTGTGKGGQSIWGKNFQDEFEGPQKHDVRGILSMANKGKNTNSSQFFITYKPAPHLDRKHTIFGRVVGGMDVLKKMEDVETDGSDRPLQKIVIKDIVVFLDPFAEFLKEKSDQEKSAAHTAEVQRQGGTDDDKITWTGKRIRDANGGDDDTSSGVGKYLKRLPVSDEPSEEILEDWTEAEPAKKKIRSGGFGNFDSW
jgi:peptidyl-prolyl cis-trans isomerase-like 2